MEVHFKYYTTISQMLVYLNTTTANVFETNGTQSIANKTKKTAISLKRCQSILSQYNVITKKCK
jgi:hypothetical protein